VVLQTFAEIRNSRSRAGIDERGRIFGEEKSGSNGAGMSGPAEIDGNSGEHERIECSAREKKDELGREKESGEAGLSNGPVALRKYLQNDEVMDYALGHSDLFYPSRSKRVLSSAEPPKVSEQAQRCGLMSCGRLKHGRWSRGRQVNYTGFFKYV